MSDKPVEAHVQRMLDEQAELSDKVGKLETFILTNQMFKQLSKDRQRLMRQQYDAMSLYNNILKERIALEQ